MPFLVTVVNLSQRISYVSLMEGHCFRCNAWCLFRNKANELEPWHLLPLKVLGGGLGQWIQDPLGAYVTYQKKMIRNKYTDNLVLLDRATLQRGRVYFTMRVCLL